MVRVLRLVASAVRYPTRRQRILLSYITITVAVGACRVMLGECEYPHEPKLWTSDPSNG